MSVIAALLSRKGQVKKVKSGSLPLLFANMPARSGGAGLGQNIAGLAKLSVWEGARRDFDPRPAQAIVSKGMGGKMLSLPMFRKGPQPFAGAIISNRI